MKHYENILAKLMMSGILLATTLVMTGSIVYLYQHGHELIQYHTFHSEPKNLISFTAIFRDALHFSALAMIQLGLYILVLVQVLRVVLTLGYFLVLRDRAFVLLSVFILAVLVYSFFK